MSSRGKDRGPPDGAPSPAVSAARRLVTRMRSYPVPVEATGPDVAALHRACATTVQNLRQALGDHGTEVLLNRSLDAIASEHPVAAQLRDGSALIASRDRLASAVQHHGEARVEAAVEALLGALIEILAKLIGEEMAIRMIDRDAPPATGEAGAS